MKKGVRSTDIVPVEVGLRQVLAPCSEGERVYVLLRCMGVRGGRAAAIAKVTVTEELEKLCVREDWREQAKDEWMAMLRPQALVALADVVAMSERWEKLDRTDKGCVMKAIQMVLVMTEPVGKVAPQGYEELIFSLRHKMGTGGSTKSMMEDYKPTDLLRIPTYLEYKKGAKDESTEGSPVSGEEDQ